MATAEMLNAANGKSRLGCTVAAKFSRQFSDEVSWQKVDPTAAAAASGEEDITEDGEIIAKFTGGHGFGKELEREPRRLEVRTYLTDKQLSNKQRRKCEAVDALYELTKDGMSIKSVALNTAAQQDFTAEGVAEDALRRAKAIKKLGIERPMTMLAGIHLGYVRILQDLLHMEVNMNQSAVIAHIVSDNAEEIVKKWTDVDFTTDELNADFNRDLIDCYCRCAREMKLKFVNRDTITVAYHKIIADAQRVTREYAAED